MARVPNTIAFHTSTMIERTLLILFFCFSMFLQGQSIVQPRIYVGVEAFNRKLFFNDEGYYGVAIGTKLLQFKFIAPEIELSFYGGVIEKKEQLDKTDLPDGYQGEAPEPIGYTTGGFNAIAYSFTPKLFFGNGDFTFVVLPKFSFSNVNSYASYYTLNSQRNEYIRNEREEINSSQLFFSLGLGFETELFEAEKLAMDLYLQFSFFDSRSAFKSILMSG